MRDIRISCEAPLVPLSELKVIQGDLKTLTKERFEDLSKAIEKDGFAFAIHYWVNDQGEKCILDGTQRYRVASKQTQDGIWKLDQVPAVQVHAASFKDAVLTLLHGASSYGTPDSQGLYELSEAAGLDVSELEEVALSGVDIDKHRAEYYESGEVEGQDDVPEAPEEAKTKLGELWLLGEHRLLIGDCTVKENVERLMGGEKADMVFTDPPYGMRLDAGYEQMKNKGTGSGNFVGTKGNNYKNVIGDHEDFSPKLIETIFDNFSDVKEMFIWGMDYFAELIPNRNEGNPIVWDKRTSESQDEGFGSCFELCWSKQKHKRYIARVLWAGVFGMGAKDETKSRVHTTQKPVKLAEWFLEQWGKDVKLVADIYLGSGSTLIACEKTGRKCYGMEIEPIYGDVIIERWCKFSGREAYRDSDKKAWSVLKSENANVQDLSCL